MLTLQEQVANTQLPDDWVLEVTNLLTMKVNKDVDLSAFADYWVTAIDIKEDRVKITVIKPQPEWYEFWK